MKQYLQYRAGASILPILRDEGLRRERIKVFAAPAGGPKWFASVGFDRALMSSGLLGDSDGRVLLVGASAGAWRCLAMACADPPSAYEKLRIAYSRNVFTAEHTSESIAAALKSNVDDFISDSDIPFILNHPHLDVAIHVVKSRGPAGSERTWVQAGALAAAFVLNAVSRHGMALFFERVVFYSGPHEPLFVRNSFRGSSVRLDLNNLRQAALATGCIPYVVAGVPEIPAAPPGRYRDGGMVDYHINQDYSAGPDGITLFFHHQRRIVPGWFDKHLSWRKPPGGSLDNVLQVYPGPEFVALLPGGRIPDRTDFTTFVHDPVERIRRWDEVSQLSGILGEEFLEAVESGKIRGLIQPMGETPGSTSEG